MKKLLCACLLCCALLICCCAAGAEELPDFAPEGMPARYAEYGYLDGDTLVIREGVEALGDPDLWEMCLEYVTSEPWELALQNTNDPDEPPSRGSLPRGLWGEGVVLSLSDLETPVMHISLPGSLRVLYSYAILCGNAMEEIRLPEGLTYSLYSAIGGTVGTLYLPSTLIGYDREMDYGAVQQDYVVAAGNPVYSSRDGVLFNGDGTELIAYPEGRSDTHYSVPAGVKRIRCLVNNELISLSLPLGLEEINWIECGSLRSLAVPPTVTSIGEWALAYCVSLENLSLPAGLAAIKDFGVDYNTGSAFLGDNGMSTARQDDDEPDDFDWGTRRKTEDSGYAVAMYMLLWNPEGKVTVYSDAGLTTPAGERACGQRVSVDWQLPGVLRFNEWDYHEGGLVYHYVLPADTLKAPAETLFTVTGARLADRPVRVRTYDRWDEEPEQFTPDEIASLQVDGSWYTEDGYLDWGTIALKDGRAMECGVWMGDLQLTCADTGGQQLGIAAGEPGQPCELLAAPDADSQRIALLWTGAQLNILEERDGWCRVWCDWNEGWLPAAQVRAVLPE